MNAEIAGKLIAKFIDQQWPLDRDKIWEIIRIGINKAWQEGKWLGMTAEFDLHRFKEANGQSYIITPASHPILLAINGKSLGLPMRDQYFMFHRNGYGDIRNRAGCDWNQDVYDLGYSAYFDKDNIISSGVRIGVRSLGVAGPNESINISGTYSDGNRVYTYHASTYGKTCGCSVNKEEVETVSGTRIPISQDFNYITNICFTDIHSITKTATRTPVEIIAIDQSNKGHLIARMEPNQQFSKYRKYLVPPALCGLPTMHALTKISQQELITSNSDSLMISNQEALISLAKGIYLMYYKDQEERGAAFILQAISVLEKEKREESSPTESPVQVQGMYEGDLPKSLQYYQ